jgi:hypothetical protein
VELTTNAYSVQSADPFQTLVRSLEGNAVNITKGNCTELSQLCEEFAFDDLTAQLSMFQPSSPMRDAETRLRMSALAGVKAVDRRAAVEPEVAQLK